LFFVIFLLKWYEISDQSDWFMPSLILRMWLE